jgi:hypothetical protein
MKKLKNKSDKYIHFYRYRWGKILLTIVAVLIIIRILLPFIVLHYANKTLASMHGYYGHVADIDIALIRGAYQLNNLYINKIDTVTNIQTSFFHTELIDLSVEWRALFHGALVGELAFERPWLRFTKDKTDPAQVQQDTSDFRQILDKFMPLRINHFEITHGTIEFRDSTSKPVVNLDMTEVYALAHNLRSVYTSGEVLPASVKAKAYLYEGHLFLNLKLNPLADKPTYVMNAELVKTNLTKLNNFLLAYGKFDVHNGTFSVYSEMAAEKGRFKGYVKPFIENLKVTGPEDRNKSFLMQLWEHIVGAAAGLLKNRKTEKIATKVPIEGNYDNPNVSTLDAVVEVLRNAFIQALVPSLDNEITLSSVMQPEEKKGFLKKLFDRNNNKKN